MNGCNTWTLTKARRRFEQMLDAADDEPQFITRRGKPLLVLVGAQRWDQMRLKDPDSASR
jgi:prevent-host-death family protein